MMMGDNSPHTHSDTQTDTSMMSDSSAVYLS